MFMDGFTMFFLRYSTVDAETINKVTTGTLLLRNTLPSTK